MATPLSKEFLQMRHRSTPILLVCTPDYRAAVAELAQVKMDDEGDDGPPVIYWDLVTGHRGLNERGRRAATGLGEAEDTINDPALLLKRSLGWFRVDPRDDRNRTKMPPLAEKSILLMVFPDNKPLQDTITAQALANVRDEFKSDRRTLVVLGRDLEMPAIVAEDVPVHRQPLPTEDEIKEAVQGIYEAVDIKPDDKAVDKAITFLRGMTKFAVEDAVARNLGRKGLNLDGIKNSQKEVIQLATNQAVKFDAAKWTFDDVGGQDAVKAYFDRLFAGPKAPRLIVRFDEIEKSISAAADGGDNTGVSQDQLKVLLTAMEDERWGGALYLGGPGVGKTLATSCIGNTYKILSLVGDLGATKASLVGESEQRIRRLVDVLKSLGGDRVFVVGTCNKLDTMPPAFLRRFNHGIWYFETPDAKERKRIWELQAKAFGIDLKQPMPRDDDWVGSDIRNCCEKAWALNCPLKEAAQSITISGQVSRSDIDQLRSLASRSGFLCASYPGPYSQDHAATRRLRDITINEAVDDVAEKLSKKSKGEKG